MLEEGLKAFLRIIADQLGENTMININGLDACHAGPPGSYDVPANFIPVLTQALEIIRTRIRGVAQCDRIFEKLPLGNTFTQIFDDDRIWINYDPSNTQGNWGWTQPNDFPNDVVITQFTLRMGFWSTCGTIVHEIAHLNGADGTSHAAENTLQYCNLKSANGPYDPNIRG